MPPRRTRNGLPLWLGEHYKDPYEYEKATASRLPGGKREVASGAFSGRYDSGNDDFMFDNKRTSAASYSISARKFRDIEKKAQPLGKEAGYLVNFEEEGLSLAITRQEVFMTVVEERYELMVENEELRKKLGEG